MSRDELTKHFRALHVHGKPVVMPNPWDIGSAKIMARLGARSLATTSSGHGFTLGLVDGGQVTREVALKHAADICAAVDVPVNGDFENGFGDNPETVAETVRMAAEAGLAGVSIEDTAVPSKNSYPFDLALERIVAAVAAARAAGIMLTARADGWLLRNYDQAEALRRCQAFADAGADVLYAPLVDAETTRELAATGVPVNVLASGDMRDLTAEEIGALGAARISVGGGLARVTQKVIIEGTRAILERGDFTILKEAASAAEIEAMLNNEPQG
ncbi:isocitrate lyase/phosphoenolpyruvate mutase family protein [Hoeflea sp.]|uniref:isocitrate lyase/PEP mutase family protein n=1 Tax=Hoeflea sp. TaxID=1940281 RepID=UPI001992AC4D|nr:isocitrate lyase/phosphoenolpyruvate mutase family protein [Hoeflea sp.]MBC7286371.1 isocitrate lyase/phosphoenolpyruvate mutase family protein [Hoeflea sp.]